MQPNWIGVYPAITTKFKENGDLDIDSNLKGLHAQVDAGVDGIILSGSLGEASTISESEKETLLKEAIVAVGSKIPSRIPKPKLQYKQSTKIQNI